ncbi:MAG: glycosyltransferase family 4 protein [Oscillospiraceae bacterium]|nr:glycosyltransferase family 4 protein [Oscillospiraceae bacterium]
MKILMVNKFLYPRGGSESYMLSLGETLSEMGHEVEYFGMFDEKNTVGNSAGQYTRNMDFHSTGPARLLYPFKILFSFEAKKKIGKVIDEFKPDVVHMNNINFQLTPSIIYAVKKRGIPLVQTVHDFQMVCPNHLLYNFDKNEPCEKCLQGSYLSCLKNKCIHGSRIKSLLGIFEALLYRILGTYKKVDLFITPSRFLEKKLLGTRKFYNGKTHTIHNFINKNRFVPSPSAAEDYIVYVGRLSKEKGVSLLAETARILPEHTFKVVGNGPDEGALLGHDNVEMMGFLTGDELWQVMSHARLLLLPSVCYENCPLSILEAHSMGVPVVTMNYGGMAELVEDGITGNLAESATPESIAEKIRKIMEDDAYHALLCSNCKKERELIMSVEDYCETLIKKYEELKD